MEFAAAERHDGKGDEAAMSFSRSQLFWSASIFSAAFFVRYLYGIVIVGPTTWSDSTMFLAHAQAVQAGHSYGMPDRPPLFPYMVALISSLTGEVNLSVTLYQIVISSLTAVLIYALGAQLFSGVVGRLAGWLAVIYYPFVNSARLIDSDTQFPFLLTLTAFLLVKARSIWHYAIAGIVFGLACLTRGAGLFALPFILLFWFTPYGQSEGRGRAAVAFTVATLLVLTPWTIRNWTMYGAVIPVSSEGAYNLFQGSQVSFLESRSINGQLLSAITGDPTMNGVKAIQPQYQPALVAYVASLWRTEPATQLWLRLISFADFWSPIERVRYYTVGMSTVYSMTLYAIVLFFFLVGVGWVLWQRRSPVFFLLGSIVGVTVLHTLSHAEQSRYRLQIEPFLIVIAMYGLVSLHQHYTAKGVS